MSEMLAVNICAPARFGRLRGAILCGYSTWTRGLSARMVPCRPQNLAGEGQAGQGGLPIY